KLQSEIRKAERAGAKIERLDAVAHMESFLQLMQATEQRHGRRPRYPPQFFSALAELAAEDDRVVWYWCEHEGRPVVSHITFIEGDTALHWQVYYDKAFSFLKANQFMLWQLIGELRPRGVHRLSLGASPPGASGLIDYKAKWGGEEYAYNCYVHKSGLGRFL
ncbi:MAG: GNAT family N-acetyltransferase, partial [candidate division Zixibacteria bacterium]|nr:GNAT family N-acetyltransferase [candidate division Zixibacteria bacterium]